MADKLYTTEQAADAIGVSRQTLQTWLAKGKIKPPKLIGKTRVWSQSQVGELKRRRKKSKR
ncbi:MAG: helix-turn-helix domain-containing protein [Candidatus Acidiferrales bacterium]